MKPAIKLAPFFVNTIPKSGSHLLRQLLMGLPGVNHNWDDHWYFEGHPHQIQEHKRRLKTLQKNECGFGHVFHSEEWLTMLNDLRMKRIFLYRDPRDVVVSYVYYVINTLQTDVFYPYLSRCSSQLDRYRAIIEGFQDGAISRPGIKEWYERFMKWAEDDQALVIKFEDLIGKHNVKEYERVITYLYPSINDDSIIQLLIKGMKDNVKPKESLTFRKGKVGSWRDEFNEELKQVMRKHAGQLLIDLNYETSLEWN